MSAVHDHALELVDQLEADMTEMTGSNPFGAAITVAGMAKLHLQSFRKLILNHEHWFDPAGAATRQHNAILDRALGRACRQTPDNGDVA